MAIAFVQTCTSGNSTTSSPVSASFTSTGGNLIVIAIANDSGSNNYITGVTDSKSNTYNKVVDLLYGGGSGSLGIWYAMNITGGASHTVNIGWTAAGSSNVGWVIQEFSGVATSSALDVSTATIASGTGTTITSGTTGTTTQADELVVVAGANGGNVALTTYTAGAGYSNAVRNGVQSSTSSAVAGLESKIVAATGTQSGTFTLGASRTWGALVATFKAATASSPSPQPMQGLPGNEVLTSFSW